MATLSFNELELVRKLELIPSRLRAAFASACAERQLVAYAKRMAQMGKSDPDVLGAILARLWNDLAGESMSDGEIQQRIDCCMKLVPHEDDVTWAAEHQAVAEDATSAVAYALRCRRNGQAQEAAWAARTAYEALDYVVISRGKINTNLAGAEDRVLSNSLVQAELVRQERDLDELHHGLVSVEELRERSKAEAKAFIP